jgi:hypothetical protein
MKINYRSLFIFLVSLFYSFGASASNDNYLGKLSDGSEIYATKHNNEQGLTLISKSKNGVKSLIWAQGRCEHFTQILKNCSECGIAGFTWVAPGENDILLSTNNPNYTKHIDIMKTACSLSTLEPQTRITLPATNDSGVSFLAYGVNSIIAKSDEFESYTNGFYRLTESSEQLCASRDLKAHVINARQLATKSSFLFGVRLATKLQIEFKCISDELSSEKHTTATERYGSFSVGRGFFGMYSAHRNSDLRESTHGNGEALEASNEFCRKRGKISLPHPASNLSGDANYIFHFVCVEL